MPPKRPIRLKQASESSRDISNVGQLGPVSPSETVPAQVNGLMPNYVGASKMFSAERKGKKGVRKAAMRHIGRRAIIPHFEDLRALYYRLLQTDDAAGTSNNSGRKRKAGSLAERALDERHNYRDPGAALRLNYFQDRILREDGRRWLWALQLGFNVLIFGVGSKLRILTHFADQYLVGESVFLVSGDGGGTILCPLT